MGAKKELSEKEKNMIFNSKWKFNIRDACVFSCKSKSTVYWIWRAGEIVPNRKHTGRPRILSKRVVKSVIKKSYEKGATTTSIIENLGFIVSKDTVRRVIKRDACKSLGKKARAKFRSWKYRVRKDWAKNTLNLMKNGYR